jgi:peroxiredoxin
MEEYNTIRELGAEVLGISVDSVDSHRAFSDKLGGCPFPLLSHPTLEVARRYDALGDDGRKSRRAVYVIDEQGAVVHKIPWYQPGNMGQFMEIFQALGLE